jgi:AcrR family transcriptional regulator
MIRAMTTSTLREQHAQATRERILSAVAELIERDEAAELTVPGVAEASGVSLRTIYRYYPTREALLEAAGRWIGDEILRSPYPQTLDEVASLYRERTRTFEQHPGLVRAMTLSEVGRQVRAYRRGERLAAIRNALEAEIPGLPEAERRRAEAVLAYLHNILAFTSMREESGLSGGEAGAAIAWAIETIVAELRRTHQPKRRSK